MRLYSPGSLPGGWIRSIAVVLTLALLLLSGCVGGRPSAGLSSGSRAPQMPSAFSTGASAPPEDFPAPDEDDDPEDDAEEEEGTSGAGVVARERASGSRARRSVGGEDEPLGDGGEGPVGWRDGVGDGRPSPVPLGLDYFQGLLEQVGVPQEVLPEDGRTLSPEQAVRLLGHLLEAEAGLVEFPRQRMAAHLLLEVATGQGPVTREVLHARMDRFHRLRVVRPDGYVVRVVT
ncbi:MAG TPA: hypothetical protein VEZ71_17960, partial [Archangium sp.]|nr:hypothetical protein [Archangium sp.]